MNNKPNKIWFLLLVFLLLINCDTDKFFGYNYDAESLIESIPISGKITSIFTGEPVDSAMIKIGMRESFSDIQGEYLVVHPLGPDEERDKPIPISIESKKYYPLNKEILIYPQPTVLNFSLEYGAPIIKKSSRIDTICTATVFDYQGISTVVEVVAEFTYVIPQISKTVVSIPMYQINIISDKSAEYKCFVPLFLDDKGNLAMHSHKVRVNDSDGFSEKTTFLD